jgi:hypothetical protein
MLTVAKALNSSWPTVYKTCSEISNYWLSLDMITAAFSTTNMAEFASGVLYNVALKVCVWLIRCTTFTLGVVPSAKYILHYETWGILHSEFINLLKSYG